MSVVKSERTQSPLEFMIEINRLERMTLEWLVRDFGKKPARFSIEELCEIKGFHPDDTLTIKSVFSKYNITELIDSYPEWNVAYFRNNLLEAIHKIKVNLELANGIFVNIPSDYDLRRHYQDNALSWCKRYEYELKSAVMYFHLSINDRLQQFILKLDRLTMLVKAWKESDRRACKNRFPEYYNFEKKISQYTFKEASFFKNKESDLI